VETDARQPAERDGGEPGVGGDVRPEPIRALGAREARARRAAERWLEGNDARGCPLDALVAKAVSSAEALGRDLTPHEVNTVCTATIASWIDAEAQRLAAEALSDAREQERLAYLARRRQEYLLTAEDRIVPPRGSRT
jgi:hypothetical protein